MRVRILALGVNGSTYKTTEKSLKDLGIEIEPMKKLLRSLHQHAVETLHAIVIQRRKLDSTLIRQHPAASLRLKDAPIPPRIQPHLRLAGSLTVQSGGSVINA